MVSDRNHDFGRTAQQTAKSPPPLLNHGGAEGAGAELRDVGCCLRIADISRQLQRSGYSGLVHRFFGIVATAAWVFCALLVLSCAKRGSPELIKVAGVENASLGLGDTLRIIGHGFPEGRSAQVELRGALYRPGQAPQKGVSIQAEGRSEGEHRVGVSISRPLYSRLVGSSPDGEHTTFRGELRIVFPSRSSRAPEVEGHLDDVVLDISSSESVDPQRLAEAKRYLQFLGLRVASQENDALRVSEVRSDAIAEAAGVQQNDILKSLDGVLVTALPDLLPAPDVRSSELEVERDGQTVTLSVQSDGFYRKPAERLLWALSGVLLVGVVLAGLGAPAGRMLTWAERWVAMSAATRGTGSRRLSQRLLGEIPPGGLNVVVATSGLFALIAMGHSVVHPELDLLALAFTGTALQVFAGFLTGQAAPGGSRVFAALRSAFAVLFFRIPTLLALGGAMIAARSFAATTLIQTQGPYPWQWAAFSTPIALISSAVLLLTLVPSAGVPKGEVARTPKASAVARVADWTGLLLLSALSVQLLFGGWRLPGSLTTASTLMSTILGLGLFSAKLCLLLGGVLALRAALPRLHVLELRGPYYRWMVPVAALAFVAKLGWAVHGENLLAGTFATALPIATCLAAVALSLYAARRLYLAAHRATPQVSLNPWL